MVPVQLVDGTTVQEDAIALVDGVRTSTFVSSRNLH